uniref:Uncharacterized protein n=1 Tax=Timema monikensis TaxID=170555 RepID=A0A7R9EF46_9NEOP|nr:unnamed protein product [Timema monikensis]
MVGVHSEGNTTIITGISCANDIEVLIPGTVNTEDSCPGQDRQITPTNKRAEPQERTASKMRKYDESYLSFRFIPLNRGEKYKEMDHQETREAPDLRNTCLNPDYALSLSSFNLQAFPPPPFNVSTMASLVLTDSSQLTADAFEKLPDQILYPYNEPDDLKKHGTSPPNRKHGKQNSACFTTQPQS